MPVCHWERVLSLNVLQPSVSNFSIIYLIFTLQNQLESTICKTNKIFLGPHPISAGGGPHWVLISLKIGSSLGTHFEEKKKMACGSSAQAVRLKTEVQACSNPEELYRYCLSCLMVMKIMFNSARFATHFWTGIALHTSPQRLHIPPIRIFSHDYHYLLRLLWVGPKLSSASLSFPSLVHAFSPILVKWNEHQNEVIDCSFRNFKS